MIEGLREYKGRNTNGFFNDLPPQDRMRARDGWPKDLSKPVYPSTPAANAGPPSSSRGALSMSGAQSIVTIVYCELPSLQKVDCARRLHVPQ